MASRMNSVAMTLQSDNESLISDIRKTMIMFKDIAVDLEADNQSQMVKELEVGFVQLLETTGDCMNFSSAIESVGKGYEPKEGLTDFKKLFDDEIERQKATTSIVPEKDPLFRQFTAAIWNVNHAGQPMPGEEEEDIIVTSTQSNLLNITCPLSGKPITALSDPVRSMDCKHIYGKKVIMQYIKATKGQQAKCPITGCPKILRADRVVCDPLLRIEIEEMKALSKQSGPTNVIEDFTDLNEEEEESE
ncbi:E3 SUMO-protein ligase MMS21 [Heracleum sosnowskyi]|uniref:E3 SUMO-protein ligase MMS21 n=1 Tax=Heracleum sosnowskyi TaxID=360622 RepID=A0AAD8J4D2_9APIA|nr:E3 SUMO-protein ligase MMS21 [Heracleum sosnowskyi]